MPYIIILSFFLAFQDHLIPFVPQEDFEYELEYFLKKKEAEAKEVYSTSEPRPAAVLPYIKIHFTFNRFEPTDKRIKVFRDNLVFVSKKIKGPMKLSLDMGYAVDMKEGVTPSQYTIYIFNEDNDKRARIEITVKPNGELLINDQTRGMI